MSQPPDDRLKALWQGQETETSAMTLGALRALARNHGGQVRDRFLMLAVLVAVEVVVFGSMALRAPNDMVRLGDGVVLFGLAFMVWRQSRRWPGRLPEAEASADALIEFHRRELVRQRSSYGDMLLTAGPVIAGTLVLVYGLHLAHPERGARTFAPFFGLMAFWFVSAWFLQRRQARRLQAEIDDLDAMRRR
jgi:hypothetical protein